ncbi:class I SAM-dependent methyltransferase [Gimesia fumaroli]|uniref:Demethylrebeccamycin-D-glucose O-methyltransferase n=1 Tax=Gimesia fumaroli TaxID=2527976 RepID=A0A518IAC4_9PLAN|nr:class I SAM-dependent methyltransferase [Gimesia fumaroli]QDV50066.1 Demethylrebeccamycin-D-glucose O-methyltransferase [Gimesia fumaroli]
MLEEETEFPLEMMFSFFEGVKRKGPGSETSTLKALSLLKELPANPQIAEFGCGSGVATIPLARSLDCSVIAVEIHQPFLDELAAIAVREGLADRIKTVQADMGIPPFPNGSFDVIWSEAAIYNVGFKRGLQLWKPLLRSGGYIVVSEVVWLTSAPPSKAKEFWEAEYPMMTMVEQNINTMSELGYDPVGHFILPLEDWQNYYDPLQEHVDEFRLMHSANAAAQNLADCLQSEIDLWKECGSSFGYCFFIGRSF